MIIFPAIDLKNARAVRLTQGDYNRVDEYSCNPCEVAQSFAAQGAGYLHVVDLDGAKDGELSNFAVVRDIIAATDMFVEVGGGIRTQQRIEQYLQAGAQRVILGTAALKDFDFLTRMVRQYGEKIAVGVDAKNGFAATDGWLQTSKVNGVDFCRKVSEIGVKSVIYTDISRDGAMQGVNLEVYRQLAQQAPQLQVTASGGVSTLNDITALRRLGTHSAIVGKALYTGALQLPQVLAAAKGDDE